MRDTGVAAGDDVIVELAPEGPQRGDLADDVAVALEASPAAAAFFDTLAQFYRKAYLRWIDGTTRRPELRLARIAEVVDLLAAGIKQRPPPPRQPVWSKNSPTPPLAPSTSSRLAAGRPSRASTTHAVPAASGVAAASANEVAGLIGAASAASITASSAYPPGAVREMRHRHDPVPWRQAGHPATHAVDDPGDVIAKDARHPQPGPLAIGPVTRVHRVDPGRMHGHPHLAGPGDRIGNPARPQLLRTAELPYQHRSHTGPSGGRPEPLHPSRPAPSRHHDISRKAVPDGGTALPAMDEDSPRARGLTRAHSMTARPGSRIVPQVTTNPHADPHPPTSRNA